MARGWLAGTVLGHWPQITTPKGWKTSELLRYEYVYEVTRRARCAVNWEPAAYSTYRISYALHMVLERCSQRRVVPQRRALHAQNFHP